MGFFENTKEMVAFADNYNAFAICDIAPGWTEFNIIAIALRFRINKNGRNYFYK